MPDEFAEFERRGWGAGRAEPYHHGIGAITSRAIDPLLDAAGVAAGMRVLDIATGPGYVAGRAAERGAEVVGIDFSPEMLELAARLHPQVEFRAGDANALPFDHESFDVVVSNFLMPHVSDLPGAVSEAARVARAGGRVGLTTWDSRRRTRFVGAVMDAFDGAGAALPPELPAGPSLFQYSPDPEFARLLLDAGLTEPIVETIRFSHHADDLDELWESILSGTVRTTALVTTQPPEVQAEIRRRFGELLEPHRTEDGWEIPTSVKLGSAEKPAG